MLVLAIYGGDGAQLQAALRPIRESLHSVRVVLGSMGPAAPGLADETALSELRGGKFANLNRLAETAGPLAADWVLLLDDDVDSIATLLDRMIVVAERFRLTFPPSLALSRQLRLVERQPASPGAAPRDSPRFAQDRPDRADEPRRLRALAPFPREEGRAGVVPALGRPCRARGRRLGVIDAVPVRHESRPPRRRSTTAPLRAAAERLPAEREHVTYAEAETVLARHTRVA